MVPALIRTPYLNADTRLAIWASFVFYCSTASCESHQPIYLLGTLTCIADVLDVLLRTVVPLNS
jgi:hypothetical protein